MRGLGNTTKRNYVDAAMRTPRRLAGNRLAVARPPRCRCRQRCRTRSLDAASRSPPRACFPAPRDRTGVSTNGGTAAVVLRERYESKAQELLIQPYGLPGASPNSSLPHQGLSDAGAELPDTKPRYFLSELLRIPVFRAAESCGRADERGDGCWRRRTRTSWPGSWVRWK